MDATGGDNEFMIDNSDENEDYPDGDKDYLDRGRDYLDRTDYGDSLDYLGSLDNMDRDPLLWQEIALVSLVSVYLLKRQSFGLREHIRREILFFPLIKIKIQ